MKPTDIFKHFNATPINKLKKGDLFRINNAETGTVYVFDGYNRTSNKYIYYKFDDVNAWAGKKKGYLVYSDINF